MIGSRNFFKKLSEKNDHDRKIERLSKQKVNITRNPDKAEIDFFKNMNAFDEEFYAAPTSKIIKYD